MSRILLIEDETSTQNLLQNRLRDLGHEVEVASTGARGLMTAREERFHLFLVDILPFTVVVQPFTYPSRSGTPGWTGAVYRSSPNTTGRLRSAIAPF